MPRSPQASEVVQITPIKLVCVHLSIIGTAPLVLQRFSDKEGYAETMTAEYKAANVPNKSTADRPPRDYEAEWPLCKHVSTDGWEGHNAIAFKKALIAACKLVHIVMKDANLCLWVLPDGFEADGTPLVRINGVGEKRMDVMTSFGHGPDPRARVMYREWSAVLRVQWEASAFTLNDIVNLTVRAGAQIGVGSGRPSSPAGGIGWGTFKVDLEGSERLSLQGGGEKEAFAQLLKEML